ncbi:MAG TPA: GerMN domain-containing protein [Spirochaetota bacterium]
MATKPKSKPKVTAKAAPQSRNLIPVYVLTIMALATAVVVMMNRSPDTMSTVVKTPKAETAQANGKERESDKETTPSGEVKDPKTAEKDPSHPETPAIVSKKVKIFFLTYNERTGKILPGAVPREVKGDNDLLLTLAELSKGLSANEEKRGLITAMPEGLTFRSVIVRDGIAEIDCSSAFMDNAQGDILTGRLNQIFLTATQFPGVKGIVIKLNGKPLKSLGGDGLVVSWPMRRLM